MALAKRHRRRSTAALAKRYRRRATVAITAAAALTAAISVAANTFLPGNACAATPLLAAAPMTLCNSWATRVADDEYTVQNNEYNSSASECLTTDGNADFTITNSAISNPGGSPGAYPFIYKGCDYGACTRDSGFPVAVANMNAGVVTTSWNTTQPGTPGDVYDVAYDIWFNQTPTTSGQPNGAELMIWLNEAGARPLGQRIATNVSIGGNTYDVFEGPQHNWVTISYERVSGTTSVTNLDVDTFTQDSVSRGYIQKSWYLLNVEAGFELWDGGAGLATNSFSVNVAGVTSDSGNQNVAPPKAPATASATPVLSAFPGVGPTLTVIGPSAFPMPTDIAPTTAEIVAGAAPSNAKCTG